MIRLGTLFSGIGAIEQALLRMNLKHSLVFACDNGELDLKLLPSDEQNEVSVSAMLVYTCQKNIAQAFILERYFFVSICPAAIPGTCLSVFLAAVLPLC